VVWGVQLYSVSAWNSFDLVVLVLTALPYMVPALAKVQVRDPQRMDPGSGFQQQRESVATPQAAREWAHPPCRHFKNLSCCCLGSGFEGDGFPNPR
jgi:hypothetical protein